jgi:hypothetical protein
MRLLKEANEVTRAQCLLEQTLDEYNSVYRLTPIARRSPTEEGPAPATPTSRARQARRQGRPASRHGQLAPWQTSSQFAERPSRHVPPSACNWAPASSKPVDSMLAAGSTYWPSHAPSRRKMPLAHFVLGRGSGRSLSPRASCFPGTPPSTTVPPSQRTGR